MKEVEIEAISRHETGKGVARKLRAAKKIPAVVYGKDEKPQPIELNYEHFHTVYHGLHGENALFNVKIDGKLSERKALIRDIQHDPVYGDILHIDFQHISMDQEIHISVSVKLVGIADGVKNFGGILQWTLRELEVSCLPTRIPENIEINIEALGIGDSVHVNDINIPGVEFLQEGEETIVSVIAPTVIKAEEAAPAAEGETVEAAAPEDEEQKEPEVISEKKAEDRKVTKEKDKKAKEKEGKE
jgi:large subunit ribosomal protein L25